MGIFRSIEDSSRNRAQSAERDLSSPRESPPGGCLRFIWRTLASAVGLATITAIVMGAAGVASYEVVRRHIRGTTVKAPLIVNESLPDALEKLRERGLTLDPIGSIPRPDLPPGIVLTQYPPPDTNVKRGSSIRVEISAGAATQAIPDVRGLEFKEAELRLEQNGFRSGRISSIESPAMERGLALASEPPARANAPKGAAVNLLISAGAPPHEVAMPRLLGRSLQEATEILAKLGLQLSGAQYEPANPEREGLVVRQTPSPGARLEGSEQITVVMGAGAIAR